ncbi:MAG TPA: hypothetical protein VFA20_06435 [Myxococcaceae bacterium]|nr:hypothetical protein [Myxococcaceae bacterium]
MVQLQPVGPIGTFEAQPTRPGEALRVVLMTDATAHLEALVMCQLGLVCPLKVDDALYTRLEAGSAGHMDFTTQSGQPLSGYSYLYSGTQLGMVRDGDAQLQVLDRAKVAWCSVATQCDNQLLPTPVCPGQWTCVNNGCQFECAAGTFVAPP